jgi:hypothetical protein
MAPLAAPAPPPTPSAVEFVQTGPTAGGRATDLEHAPELSEAATAAGAK